MLTRRVGTSPLPSDHYDLQQTPRASSEHEARSEPRTSTSDEAQACFNLIMILRNDTQHLIALRNDNIQSLEEIVAARPLLASINEAITTATRSIHELGPFLERHRWPPEPSSRCRSSMRLRALRKRSRSLSAPSAGIGTDPNLSPEELFSWTLALTVQHNDVLCALGRLEDFLVYGTAVLNEEDRRRHAATRSWWQQRRGEFENVGLIQSILQGPKRNPRKYAEGTAAPTVSIPARRPGAHEIGVAVTSSSPTATATLTSISEHDDGRSDTFTFYEQSIRSGHGDILHGLTVRPRTRPENTPQNQGYLPCESTNVRLMKPGPWTHPQPYSAIEPQEPQAGPQAIEATPAPTDAGPRLPLSRFNSDPRRPKMARAQLPPLVGLQALITGSPPRNVSAGGRITTVHSPDQMTSPVSPCSPLTASPSPLTSPPGLSQNSSRVSLPSPIQPSPSSETPYTPLDQQVATMFAQRTLPTKMIQPVVHALLSPADSMSPVLELGASPVTSSRYSQESGLLQQGRGQRRGGGGAGAEAQGEQEGGEVGYVEGDDDDRHWPYLAYMARKQAVATSRWSVRRSQARSEG